MLSVRSPTVRDRTDHRHSLIARDGVLVRWFRLGVDGVVLCDQQHLLSSHERDRADRFRFDSHRRRFVARRIALRLVIAEAIGCPPDRCPLAWTADGRPVLDIKGPPICVSTSHSGKLGVIAIGPGSVGVDVERVDASLPVHDLAERCLAPAEQRWLLDRPPVDRLAGFCRLWTRKEAYLKARGIPLASVDLTQLSVLTGDHCVIPPSWLISDLPTCDDGVFSLVAAPPAVRVLSQRMVLDFELNSVAS